MAKRNRRRPRNRRSRQRQRSANKEPIMLTLGDADCACPICALNAGKPSFTVDDRGNVIERPAQPAVAMMTIRVHGDNTTWPYLDPEPQDLAIPEGCVVHDMLAYLCFADQRLMFAFPSGTLSGRIDGKVCDPMQVLRPGDTVRVSGIHDAEARAQMARLLTPL